MNDFKILEIINSNILRVHPQWAVLSVDDNQQHIGDRILIAGMNVKSFDPLIMQRLKSILLNKDVELINPQLEFIDGLAVVKCNVLIENTDITYYFPEYTDKKSSHGLLAHMLT